MITSEQEYMFVSFGKDVEVDGDIMPKRDDKSLLRGVDAGFLREAYEERDVASGGNRASPLELNGKVSSSWLWTVASGYEAFVTRQISYNTGRFVKSVPLSARLATSYPPIADFGMGFPVSDLESNKAAFSTGSRLGKEAVLALFTDTQALRTFVLGNPVYTTEWQKWTMSTQGDASAVSGYNTGYLYAWRSNYTRGDVVATGSKTVSGGALTFKVPDADLVGNCTILLLASVTRTPPQILGSQTKYCWIPLEATRSGDSFTVDALNLYSAVTTAMQVTGLALPPKPNAQSPSNSSIFTVSASQVYAVCTLTDHTNQE